MQPTTMPSTMEAISMGVGLRRRRLFRSVAASALDLVAEEVVLAVLEAVEKAAADAAVIVLRELHRVGDDRRLVLGHRLEGLDQLVRRKVAAGPAQTLDKEVDGRVTL